MSLHRRAAKRDSNEPAIVSALEAHGCVVWRVSGKGLPDLVVFYPHFRRVGGGTRCRTFVADVKGPKEKATPAQEEKWTALINLGFSVFILRTPEDAQKMLNNALQPWEPRPNIYDPRHPYQKDMKRRKAQQELAPRKGDAARARGCGCREKNIACIHVAMAYTPPSSRPVTHSPDCEQVYHNDAREPCTCGALAAAKEAEATFAPKAEPDWHELVDEAVAISKEQCACRLGVLCSYHKARP